MIEPSTTPRTIEATPAQNDKPNSTGKAPSMQVANVLAPPKIMRNRSNGDAQRSVSGIRSTPKVSIHVNET
ncbi:hypothetical protein D3C85_1864590 [compost metagenome]